MKRAEAMQLVQRLANAYPVPAWSLATINLFAENLEDLDAKKCDEQVRKWIRHHISRPTVCDIRRETQSNGFVC